MAGASRPLGSSRVFVRLWEISEGTSRTIVPVVYMLTFGRGPFALTDVLKNGPNGLRSRGRVHDDTTFCPPFTILLTLALHSQSGGIPSNLRSAHRMTLSLYRYTLPPMRSITLTTGRSYESPGRTGLSVSYCCWRGGDGRRRLKPLSGAKTHVQRGITLCATLFALWKP